MTTQITTTNIQPAALAFIQGPVVSSIQITDSSYTVLDDTAVDTAGGYIKINGVNFVAGMNVVIGSVTATSVSVVSSTVLNVQVPAQSAGTYIVYVIAPDGGVSIVINGLTYSGTPTWVTGSTLTGGQVDIAISIQLDATGATSYALAAGSSLPAGLTLSSGGLLSGTVTGITVETLYNFTVNAIDNELQDSPRAFSITISANDQYFEYVTALLSASTPASTFVTDASTNAFNVTVFGDTRPSNFGPYTPGYYSNFFDGTGDYLTVPDNAAFEMTADFTVEAWFYPTSNATDYQTIVSKSASGIYAPYIFYYRGTLGTVQFSSSTDGATYNLANYTSLGSVTLNTWNHVAVSRSGSSVRLFLNGTLVTTITNSSALTDNNNAVGIGGRSDGTELLTGYISNVRIVKGTGLYTASFTPSNTPLTVVSGTSLLTCLNNRITDSSTNNFTITRNGDVTVNSFDPFLPSSSFAGRGSGFFDGTGDYLSVPDNEAFNFPGDFTIECWLYPTSHPTAVYLIGQSSSTDYAPVLLYLSNGRPGIGASSNGSTWAVNAFVATALTLNTWSHVAMVRSGNKWSIYVNGVENVIAASTAVTPYNSTDPLGIGGEAAGSLTYPYVGYMTDVRIVKGTAVYTTNFTPPATPLTAIANTQLLTLQNNQPNNNSMFLDSSTNNFNITRNGNTTQGAFSPYGGGWSIYNSNTADSGLGAAANSALDMGTGNFTIEAWVNTSQLPTTNAFQTSSGGYQSIFGTGPSSSSTGSQLYIGTTNLFFDIASDGSGPISVAHGMTAGQWYHVAITRSGNTFRAFVNGALLQTGTSSSSWVNGYAWGIMRAEPIGGYTGAWWFGYVSNFRVIKGTALYTTNFTPSTDPLTPVAGTSLLTCADNRFIDDSANNITITRTSSASVQRFNPFNPVVTTPTSYSGYFDGTGDSLSFTPNSSFAFGTGNFTVECWYYPTSAVTSEYLIDNRNASQLATWVLTYNWTGSNSGTLYWYNGSTALGQISGSTITNAWNHIAYVRAGTTGSLYINGTRVATQTDSTNYSNTPLSSKIGDRYVNTGADQYAKGYISNFRVVNGTAVYDPSQTTITVPSSPLTATANTALLTLQSATFVDNSTNNFAITASGNSAPRQFNPFGWTSTTGGSAAYTPALYGGSGYFDGSGDFLTIPSNNAFVFGTGDFTLESWTYLTSAPASPLGSIVANGGNSNVTSNVSFNLYITSALVPSLYIGTSTTGSITLTSSTAITIGAWNHIAATRSGNTFTLWLNGVSVATGTSSVNISALLDVFVSKAYSDLDNRYITGYISDLRLTKGQARYTSNFAPPVAPLTALQNTVLLNNMTGAGIYDSSMMANYETVGNASINTALKKYGNTSMYFDGTGDYVFAPSSATTILAGDFTIELWAYRAASGNYRAFTIGDTVGTSGIEIYVSGTPTGNWVAYSNSATRITGASATRETWTHLALVRSGSTVTLYVNGTASGSAWSSSATFSGAVYVGAELFNSGVTSDTNGYIDDFRITNGVARYTSNFTPSASPFIRF